MHPIITSIQNPKIKNILSLEKARERKKQNQFVIEGVRELGFAIGAGYKIDSVFFCPTIIASSAILAIVQNEQLLVPVDENVFSKIAYRESTEGVIALAEKKHHALSAIKLGANPLLLVLESVEKPGNLGAVLRTADAARTDAVIICDPLVDFYNPNVIRSSIGCVFSNQLASAPTEETIDWLSRNDILIYCTHLGASKPYHEVDFTKPCAIVMGTESSGLSERWINHSSKNIIIPMQGKIDSLNVSTAAAIVVFEASRQRGFNASANN